MHGFAYSPYDEPDSGPDGRIEALAPTWENNPCCELLEVYSGSFTGAGAEQVLLAMKSPYGV